MITSARGVLRLGLSVLSRGASHSSRSTRPLQMSSNAFLSTAELASGLVSPAWLHSHQTAVTVLDGSWYMPAAARNVHEEYRQQRIPSARFFDIDAVCDKTSGLPHMLPTEELFSAVAAQLGISKHRPVIVYDSAGIFSAPRVWWTLKAFGHPAVAVLDGGLPRWMAEGHPVTTTTPEEDIACLPVEEEEWRLDHSLVATLQDVRELATERQSGNYTAGLHVDARPKLRFTGEAPEPRAGLASGHTPCAVNVPYTEVLSSPGPFIGMKTTEELEHIFRDAGVDHLSKSPLVLSCGSGVSACVLALALATSGRAFQDTKLYDGSWTEYAASGAPIALG
jgi:thiosulfate/3-mercaptopyruvate sulfurtransferase